MKMYDRVKLIKERAEYLKAGVKINEEGILMGENRNGYVLVVFEGDVYLDVDGVYKTTEIDVGIKIEDLEFEIVNNNEIKELIVINKNNKESYE